MKIDSKAIKELAKILDETGLSEIEVADGEKVLRVCKNSSVTVQPAAASMPSDPAIPQKASLSTPEAPTIDSANAITSPMVGTVYLSPEPGADTFAPVGASVKAGDTLMIVEAMKVMNPIKAEKAGTVKQVLVDDGQPVEFGDALIIIE